MVNNKDVIKFRGYFYHTKDNDSIDISSVIMHCLPNDGKVFLKICDEYSHLVEIYENDISKIKITSELLNKIHEKCPRVIGVLLSRGFLIEQ